MTENGKIMKDTAEERFALQDNQSFLCRLRFSSLHERSVHK